MSFDTRKAKLETVKLQKIETCENSTFIDCPWKTLSLSPVNNLLRSNWSCGYKVRTSYLISPVTSLPYCYVAFDHPLWRRKDGQISSKRKEILLPSPFHFLNTPWFQTYNFHYRIEECERDFIENLATNDKIILLLGDISKEDPVFFVWQNY